MAATTHRIWPYGARAALLTAALVFFGLLIILTVMREASGWPSDSSERTVLLGVFVFSLVPIGMAVIDALAERGAVVEYGGVKLDFSRVSVPARPSASVPVNIGAPGRPITDSDTAQILQSLREAVATDVVVVDLEDGAEWWETRLLVLLAGATRLGRPRAVVFVATDRGVARRFQGWGEPDELFRRLVRSNRQYQESYWAARSAARQWELVSPPPTPGTQPPPLLWMQGLAVQHQGMAFDASTQLPNDLAAEQYLAAALGATVEQGGDRPLGISAVRLEELFKPILHGEEIDETWPGDRQLRAFLDGSDAHVAVTHAGRYERLLPRVTGLTVILKGMVAQGGSAQP